MTVRALLTAPELYTVGAAVNGVYDFVDHGATGLEGYLGLPADNPEGYAAGSSLTLADRLEGELLLMHGTADVNATFSATMKLVDALLRAGKRFDLMVLPGQNHHYEGYALDYRRDAVRRHLQEHLRP
jgi:dipeptidyl aminopeptidase/acylaminoacyl peptidase